MSWQKIVETRIQDAMAAGAFANLKGEGKPLPDRSMEAALAGEMWLGYHILSNGGHLPGWLGLGKEIERDLEALARVETRFSRHLANARRSGDWAHWHGAVIGAREDYEVLARKIRAKQDKFNIEAPGVGVERPALWVERELERLDGLARTSGAPAAWFDALKPLPSPPAPKADPERLLFGVAMLRDRK